MKPTPHVLAIGIVDDDRIAGSSGLVVPWTRLGLRAPGDGRTFRAVFGRRDETFRRLDPVSRTLVLAGEAAGIHTVVPRAQVVNTAVVFETVVGCLESDLKFARSMAAGLCDGPVFPYTLPSTSLGELAMRFSLRGPSVCVSTTAGQCGVALREAAHMLATLEVEFAVAGRIDVLRSERPSVEPICRALVVVLAAAAGTSPAVAAWPGDSANAYDELARAIP